MWHKVLRQGSRLFILSLTALCLPVQAQTGKLFDADKQLSSSFTSQVYLDHDGFIWVATRNGVNKYDGYRFHIIRKEGGQHRGMASNYVNCITQDSSGLFWQNSTSSSTVREGSQGTT